MKAELIDMFEKDLTFESFKLIERFGKLVCSLLILEMALQDNRVVFGELTEGKSQ